MDADLDTLATALYARTDDLLKAAPGGRRGGHLPISARGSLMLSW